MRIPDDNSRCICSSAYVSVGESRSLGVFLRRHGAYAGVFRRVWSQKTCFCKLFRKNKIFLRLVFAHKLYVLDLSCIHGKYTAVIIFFDYHGFFIGERI